MLLPEDHLQPSAFDFQPTPVIVLSEENTVVLLNRACHRLLDKPQTFIGKHVKHLPVVWQDGTLHDLHDLVTNPQLQADGAVPNGDDYPYKMLKLEVNISDQVTAKMLVTNFVVSNTAYRMLSFESIQEKRESSSLLPESDLGEALTPRDESQASKNRKKPYALSRLGSSHGTSQSHLDARFAQLREAIYFNDVEERAGFLLSADETFCYPNYTKGQAVAPVEIDDIGLFFGSWDMWDAQFIRKIPLSEFPSIWLNKHKTTFRNKRYGLREDGKDIVIDATGRPLFDPVSGEYLGGVVWITALGEHAEVEAADLKTSLLDFRTICQRLPHKLWTANPEGDVDYFSQTWYNFSGLTEEESLGLGYTSAIHPDDLEHLWECFRKCAPAKTEIHAEARYRRHDGEYVWMYARAKPFVCSQGVIQKWYGSLTNIHNMVTARIEAEKKKDQMMDMLRNADIGLFSYQTNAKLVILEGKLGWLNGERNVQVPISALDNELGDGIRELKAKIRDIAEGRQKSALFEAHIHSRWYKFRLIDDGEGEIDARPKTAVLGCSIDITEQRERANLEAENARLTAETSLEMHRSQLKSAFLAHVSHEIRTPIAGILGSAEMLVDSCTSSEQREGLGDIQISANNLLTIVNDILDLSKIEAGQLKFEKFPFDLHDLIAQVRKLFVFTARSKSLELTCKISQALEMQGDPGRVTQILTNLVSNAIKFTSEGSVDISVEDKGPNVQITVQDTGEGIDSQTLSTLFKPFVQGDASTARRHGGTGLGLTISRNLAQKMGGSLELESLPMFGTKATVILPKEMAFVEDQQILETQEQSNPAEAHSKQARPKQQRPMPSTRRSAFRSSSMRTPSPSSTVSRRSSIGPQPGSRPRTPSPSGHSQSQPLVLLVEDNAINLKIALNLVKKLGYKARTAGNGQEAIDFLENASAPDLPSAILMDCQMPLMDGYEATRHLRADPKYEKVRDIPIIALTASAIQGDREKCQAAGMDDYLSKPIKKELVKEMLEKWIPAPGSASTPLDLLKRNPVASITGTGSSTEASGLES